MIFSENRVRGIARARIKQPPTRLAPRNRSVLATLSRRGRGYPSVPHLLASRESLRLDQAARMGDFGEVMVGVAEYRVDRGDALEIMSDLVLHGHADAAVELHRLLADEPAGAPDLRLRGGDRPVAQRLVLFGDHHGGEQRHA